MDGVLGIQTGGCRMVGGADQTMELWQPPIHHKSVLSTFLGHYLTYHRHAFLSRILSLCVFTIILTHRGSQEGAFATIFFLT